MPRTGPCTWCGWDGVKARIVDDAADRGLGEGALAAPVKPSGFGQVSIELTVPADMGVGSEHQVSVNTNFYDGKPRPRTPLSSASIWTSSAWKRWSPTCPLRPPSRMVAGLRLD